MKSFGNYIFEFRVDENKHELKLEVEEFHFNVVSKNDSIIIEDDRISVLNKGQILNFDFSISGIFHLQKVSIYINALDFTNVNEVSARKVTPVTRTTYAVECFTGDSRTHSHGVYTKRV